MIDFHSHILPGIDDGSHDIEESLELLKICEEQKSTEVVLTPHFYADKTSFDHFLERRSQSMNRLTEAMHRMDSSYPSLYLGAEVHYFDSIGRAEVLPKLCIEGTNLLLLEMPFGQWDKTMLTSIEDIRRRQKLQVVLAHVERYFPFQKDKAVMEELLAMPVYVQLNAGSFLKWQKRRKCLKLIKRDLKIVLGSDCHNTHTRVPNLAQGRAVIAEKLGQDYLQRIDALGERILQL